jgi:hypothetical protein
VFDVFVRLMNEALNSYLGKVVVVYVDDILVFNKTKEEPLMHLEQVLERVK